MEKTEQISFDGFLKKIEELKKNKIADLSTAEDLSLAVMNLISLEEHFFFTGAKTGNGIYYDLSHEAREVRKKLLAELVPVHEGETWCASKHLLAATMRLVEVGNKLHSEGKKREAEEMFKTAYRVYSMFWGVRLKLLDVRRLKGEKQEKENEKPWTLEDLVTKLANCCEE